MVPGQAKMIGALVVAVILSALITWFGVDYMSLRAAAAQNEQRGTTITTTAAVVGDGEAADADRAYVDTGVSAARDTFYQSQSEAKRNEPTTAARATRVVPDSVRNSYRERRLARERLDRYGSGNEARSGTEDPAER